MQTWKKTGGLVLVCLTGLLVACAPAKPEVDVQKTEQKPSATPPDPARFATPLAEEETGRSARLTIPYGKNWAIIHDANFTSMIDGRFIVFDSAARANAYKGTMHGGTIAGFAVSKTRGELYISTTYHDRGISGKRTDIIAIHNPENLEKIGEIILPPKRGQNMPFKASFNLSGDESLGFVYNFTPAASISIIDMVGRKVLGEVPIPGCTLAYRMGKTGFASLCGDGTMMGVGLDAQGNVVDQTRSGKFNDIDHDSLFLKRARFGDVLYFPTFTGNIQPVDLSGGTPKPLAKWSMLNEAERKANWRPGGVQLIAGDTQGTLYILMHKGGAEGTQKNGGSEVWMFDTKTQKRTGRIKLKTWGVSVAVAGDNLIVTNAEMQLDIYDNKTGTFSHTFGDGLFTPLVVYTADGQ